jgi:hypothetical protein
MLELAMVFWVAVAKGIIIGAPIGLIILGIFWVISLFD